MDDHHLSNITKLEKKHIHTIGLHSCKGYLFKPKLKIEFKIYLKKFKCILNHLA